MRPLRSLSNRPRIPAGERIYAIGDVHGELDLLADLLGMIRQDSSVREPCRTTIILLGDIIDRGPGAAELLHGLAEEGHARLVILRGNHETAMVEAYLGDEQAAHFWLEFGGAATLAGFGIPPSVIAERKPADVIAAMRERIDRRLLEWLAGLPLSWSAGDYFFVHAGIRPGVPLAEQEEEDLLWIREDFLKSRRQHPQVIVHGHTPEPGPVQLRHNRIGLDTGAHEYGTLSALGLEGESRWTLQAGEHGAVSDRWPNGASYGDVHRLLAELLDESRVEGRRGAASRDAVLSPTPQQQPRRAPPLLGIGGSVTVGAAVAASFTAGALVMGLIGGGRAEPPTTARVTAAEALAPAAVSTGRAMSQDTPAAPDAQLAAESAGASQADAGGTSAARSSSARGARRPVDPYAGRVARPLTGAARDEAVLADQLATRELNEQQMGAAAAERADEDATTVLFSDSKADADEADEPVRTWRRRAAGANNRPRVRPGGARP